MHFLKKIWRQIPRALRAMAILCVICATVFAVSAELQKARKALQKNEVIELLESGVSPRRVGQLAREYGVAFELTAEAEIQLRDAGASEDLLRTLRQLTPRPAMSSASACVLLIGATPGGAQAYVDDEPMGTTSAAGRLKLTRLAPGPHRLRLSLAGYRDHEQSVTLMPGETFRVEVNLEAAGATGSPGNPLAAPGQAAPASANPLAVQPPVSAVARFSVAHDHGAGGSDYCLGEILVGSGRIVFRGFNGLHFFDHPLSAVKESKKNAVYLAAIGGFHIRFKKKGNYNFVMLDAAGQPQSPDVLLAALTRGMGGD